MDSGKYVFAQILQFVNKGKYSRSAIKIHTVFELRGSIPTFIFITDGKYHDSNILDKIVPQPDTIYLMDKAYIDFASLCKMNKADAFFVTRVKVTVNYRVLENNFNLDETIGLRNDKTIKLKGYKSKQLYPDTLRLVEYYDDEKGLLLTFITNNFKVSSLEITRLYRNRWQIGVFIKWINQEPYHKNALGSFRKCGKCPHCDRYL